METVTETPAEQKQRALFQVLTVCSCIAFGIAMIANTQLACDGAWYWYALLLHGGQHLYSNLHVVFQPLPVLEADAWMSLAGKGWMLSKVPAVLTVIVFLFAIFLLAGKSAWTDIEKAVLIASVFFVSIHFEAYRFDDYHVVSDICYLFAMFLLFTLDKNQDRTDSSRRQLAIAAGLGVLAGLTITNRVTDGAGLLICSLLAIACIARARRLILLTTFSAVALLVVLSIVALTGDSFGVYLSNTILHAAGPKGGAANVMVRPFLLFWNSLVYLAAWKHLMVILLALLIAASWVFLLQRFSRSEIRKSGTKALVGIVIIGGSLYLLRPYLTRGRIIVDLSALLVLVLYGLVLVVAFRVLSHLFRGDWKSSSARTEIVVLLPFALLLAGSLSSGGLHFGLYGPIAFLFLISPVIFPAVFKRRWFQSSFLALAALMALSGAWAKVIAPASWLSYRTFPMFSNRLLIHHPVYGPMVIDNELHHFMERTCAIVKTQPNPDLLSIPLPYANYYCAISPWEGYVQTFFDTAGKDVIDNLMSKLDHSPPQWVLYQRQLDELLRHEVLYNNSKHLPQRDLDDFIVKKVRSGQWIVVDRAPYLGDQWVLIKTH